MVTSTASACGKSCDAKPFPQYAAAAAARAASATAGHRWAISATKNNPRGAGLPDVNRPLSSWASATAEIGSSGPATPVISPDGSYPVVGDDSEMFVEFSVESVREALKRKAPGASLPPSLRQSDCRSGDDVSDIPEDASEEDAVLITNRSRRKRNRDRLFEHMPDSALAKITPDDLDVQQLLYALGRTYFLTTSAKCEAGCHAEEASPAVSIPPEQWRALVKSLRGRIHELGPLEITRACQSLAYVKKFFDSQLVKNDFDPKEDSEATSNRHNWMSAQAECCAAFEEMQVHIATHVHLLHGDCLSRVFYASLKGGFPEKAGFTEFICAEIIGRLNKLRPWHVFRVFQSSVHRETVGKEFLSTLAQHLVKTLAYLPAESIGLLIPALVKLRIFESPNYLAKLNVVAGKRFRGLTDPNLLLSFGIPALSYKLLTPVNVVALLKGLMRTKVPTAYPLPELSNSPSKCLHGLETAAANMTSAEVLEVHNVNKTLFALKLLELCIRHDHSELYKALSPSVTCWLEKVRTTYVKLTSFAPPLEPQHVNAPLLRVVAADYHLHPSLYGPFLLELSDPLSRGAVEWDKPWLLFPSWNRFAQQTYALQKQRYLRAEGWNVILVPLEPYLEEEDTIAKERYLRRVARELIPKELLRERK